MAHIKFILEVNDVNFEIVIPNKRLKTSIVPVNQCKQWHPAEATVLRILVTAEK